MNASERLSALTPQSTDSEVLEALLAVLFVDGMRGSTGLGAIQVHLARVRSTQLKELLWPDGRPEPQAEPTAAQFEPNHAPVTGEADPEVAIER